MMRTVCLLVVVLCAGTAHAQVSNMPPHVQDRLAEVGDGLRQEGMRFPEPQSKSSYVEASG